MLARRSQPHSSRASLIPRMACLVRSSFSIDREADLAGPRSRRSRDKRQSPIACLRGTESATDKPLWAVVEAEEQRGLGTGLGLGNQLCLLLLADRREVVREVHVLFELRDRVAADDDRADRPRQRVVHGFAHGQRAGLVGLDGHAFPRVLLLLDGRRRPGGKDASAAGNLHADDAHLLFDRERQQLVVEAVVVRVGGVHGHEDAVEVVAVDALDQRFGPVVAGDAEMPHHLLLLHLEQRFHGAALGEDLVDIVLRADVVQLPEVDVIGLEQLERLLDHAHGAVARALLGLGGEEGLVAALGHDLADVLLAPALRAAVDGRRVDVVDAQVEGALDDGHGDVEVVGLLERGLAAEREDADFVAGLAQIARGHGAVGARILRESGQSFVRGRSEGRRREERGRCRSADLEKIATTLAAR